MISKAATIVLLVSFSILPTALAGIIPAMATAHVSPTGGYMFGGWGGMFLVVNTGETNVGLIQFDLAALAGPPVSAAQLDLFHDMNGGNGSQYGIYRNSSPWLGVTTDWATRPATEGTPAGVLTISDNNQYLSRTVDITALVLGWLGGAYPNYGVTLQRIDSPIPTIMIASQDRFDFRGLPIAGPRLEWTEGEVPEPSGWLLLGSGLLLAALARRRGL